MRKMQCLPVIYLVLGFLMAANVALGQQRPVSRSFGLSTSIQSSQTLILVPIWVSPTITVAPGFSLTYMESLSTDVGLALVPKFYTMMGRVAPYISLQGVAFVNFPSGGGGNTYDILVGAGFGGDYFINPNFCFGVEAQLTGTVSDNGSTRFGNPGNFNLMTGAAASVSIFF